MLGEKVLVRHTSNGNGRSIMSKHRTTDVITRVFSHRDEYGNSVIGVASGDMYSIQKGPKGWQTVN